MASVTNSHLTTGPGSPAGIKIPYVAEVNASGEVVNPATSDLQTAGNAILTTIDADTGAIKTATEKGGLGESTTVAFLSWGNADAMVPGTSVDAKVLAADQPYITASIQAQKEVAGATEPPIPNAGTVWLCGAAEDLEGAKSLPTAQAMPLHDNGNLNEYYGAVTNADDGLSITYTV